MVRVESEPVFVLHRRPYRETSLLVEGFSLNHGRIGLVCRGVRRRRVADLHPFQLLEGSWQGRGDLFTMTRSEVSRSHRLVVTRNSICGLYLNELLLKLMPRGVPAPGLFRCYAQTLATLTAARDVEPALRVFEFELLRALGYGLQLEHDSVGKPLSSNGRYRFVGESGLVYCDGDGAARDTVSGDAVRALRDQRLGDRELARQVKHLLGMALEHQLQGRELQTRKLLRFVESQGDRD
ncbi:MAG: DNA repair protein RecO [Pseudomonadota bacterium]|nr:DNA repair protein RecO [Pseudomonadota bacterium]